MDEHVLSGHRRLDLIKLGKRLNVTSTGKEMRLLTCPVCKKMDIVNKKTTQVICLCGIKIKMQERWYED